MSRDNHENDHFDDPEAMAEAEAKAEQDALEAEMDDILEGGSPKSQKARALEVLDKLQGENEELKDRALRVTAEMENLRKRTAREVSDARTYATSNFARDMLNVADNLQRALEAIPAEKREEGSEAFKALIEGVELTGRELNNALARNGVKPVDAAGARFDPNLHQAMFEVPDPEQPSGMVAQVIAPGYTIGERVLRPAMVGVTKGGPKYVAPDDEPTGDGEPASDGEPAGEDEVSDRVEVPEQADDAA